MLASTPGDVVAVRMPVQHRQRLHVGLKHLDRNEARFGERRIEGAARVALAQDQPIPVGRARRFRIDPQHAEIQRRQNVRTDMSPPG